jgi:hypothetical protein
MKNIFWLLVLTILKNIKVNGTDYPIHYGKSKMFENHQPVFHLLSYGTNHECFSWNVSNQNGQPEHNKMPHDASKNLNSYHDVLSSYVLLLEFAMEMG